MKGIVFFISLLPVAVSGQVSEPNTLIDLSASRSAANVSIGKGISAYFQVLESLHGPSPLSVREKRKDLEHFENFLAHHVCKNPRLQDITALHGREFIKWRLEHGDAKSTVKRRVMTLRQFGQLLESHYSDFRNPFHHLKAPKFEPKKPKVVTQQMFDDLRAEIRPSDMSDFKQVTRWALLDLYLVTGLRCIELVRINYGQLDLERMYLFNVWTKHSRIVDIPLPRTVLESISNYLVMREHIAPSGNEYPLIISTHGAKKGEPKTWRMSTKTAYRWAKDATTKAGYPEGSRSTHITRSGYGQEVVRNIPGSMSAPRAIEVVKQTMRLSSYQVAMGYLGVEDDVVMGILSRTGERV